MKIYIVYDQDDSMTYAVAAVKLLNTLKPAPKMYLVSAGKFAWELALGMGLTGVISTTRNELGQVVLEDVRIKD